MLTLFIFMRVRFTSPSALLEFLSYENLLTTFGTIFFRPLSSISCPEVSNTYAQQLLHERCLHEKKSVGLLLSKRYKSYFLSLLISSSCLDAQATIFNSGVVALTHARTHVHTHTHIYGEKIFIPRECLTLSPSC